MPSARPVDRRVFLVRAGRAALGVVVSAAGVACTSGSAVGPAAPASVTPAPPDGSRSPVPGETDGGDAAARADRTTGGAFDWRRVDLGFVSAYLLIDDTRAVVVDTGTQGSETDIEAALASVGLGWDAVGDVVLTHRHPDHVGSAIPVLEATGARAHAGAADVDAIGAPDRINPLVDGDEVAGLRIVATPGHTPGHVCVHDPIGRIMVAGDALVGRADGRGVDGPDATFTQDLDQAHASVRRLATYDFDTLLVGHGEPVGQGARRLVQELAEQLGS